MRKIVSILLFVALATVLAVGSASAAVTNTAHDVTLIDPSVGTCSACHIPHKTMGNKRLWAVPMAAGVGDGTVGNLCAACHAVVAGGYSGTTAEAALAAPYVFPSSALSLAHGLDSNWATSSTGQNGGAGDELASLVSSLPYLKIGTGAGDPEDSGTNNLIQCTSCHNVHDNANRPFLRRNIRDLCITCHLGRAGGGTPDAGGDAAVIPATWNGGWGAANYGSHPVGPDVDEVSTLGRDEIITFNIDNEWFNFFEGDGNGGGGAIDGATAPSDASGRWNLGRHAAGSTINAGVPGPATNAGRVGGVVCVSCHAVHGYQNDADAIYTATGNMVPVGNLLGIEQSQGGTGSVMLAFNGAGDTSNKLCERCHHNSDTASSAPWGSAAAWATAGNFTMNNNVVYSGALWPNPGATPYTHPIDDAVKMNDIVTSFNGGLWPAGPGTGDYPICESCHVPHPLRDVARNTARTDINAGATSFILRDDLEAICNGCHGAGTTVADHHPTGTMAAFTGVTPGSGRTGNGATRRTSGWTSASGNGRIGDSNNALTCGDCHNAGTAGGAAHNWDGPLSGVALDPDWDADSESCEKCHYRIRTGGLTVNLTPTHIKGQDWGTADHAATPNPDGNAGAQYDKGAGAADAVGTHFLGNITTGFAWSNGQDGADAQFNASTSDWPTNIPGVSNTAPNVPGRSIFGSRLADDSATTGATHLICESCHELEPNKNSQKLLLADFAEGATVPDLADSFFCEGCHGHNPGMEFATDSSQAKSHPLTGDIVSRTGNPVNQASFPTIGQASYPATATRLTCDSCHQVHDAATNSATYILDGADSTATLNTGASLNIGRGGAVTAPHVEHPRGVYVSTSSSFTGAGLNYDGFCQQCHAY